MKKEIIVSISILLLILVLAGFVFFKGDITKKSVERDSNPELDKYRSEEIPEECKLPKYEKDIESWKEHLSHHQNTLYCLNYFN